jgi:hypothetical protein
MVEYSSKSLATTFFERVDSKEINGKTITTFKCQCGISRSQDLKKGFVNLVSHIKSQHPDWQGVMDAKMKNKDQTHLFVNKKASTYFAWLEWIVMDNLPFTFVEKPLTRKNTKLDPIGVTSLMKYLKKLTEEVEKKASDELPDKFGLILDGWSEGNTHYIAVFACFPKNSVTKTILLAIAPPFDEENYDAPSHKSFIVDVLDLFEKKTENVLFLVGDNAPVNKSLSDLLGIPFIGCASHRFNLACKRYLIPYEETLQNINTLMVSLRTIKKAGKLRKATNLEPIKRNVTRWSSTYSMLKRFFELKPFLDETDEDIARYIPESCSKSSPQKQT